MPMNFNLDHSILLLERTPIMLDAMLKGIPADWTHQNEGPDTWSPFDVIGHLIHGEQTDWVPRMEIILSKESNKPFPPFDRFAQYEISKGRTLDELLETFKQMRVKSITILKAKKLTEADLQRKGIHPAFGEVTLSQLLATWVVHDLNHLAQIARVMAKQYKQEVGPWVEYLRVLNS